MTRLAYLVLAGCALTSRSAPVEERYFTPELAAKAPPPAHATVARVRLGRVVPGEHLRGAIVHRNSAVELEPYETLHWTESPEVYVRRSLTRSLFEIRPLEQALGGDAATLDVEIVAFEEVRRGGARAGRVVLRYTLHDGRHVIDRGVITSEHPARDARIESVVAEIGVSLEDASSHLGDRVIAATQALREASR
jgi:cholesterol transport system auxiliary component